jgi:guanosine-diphosphatase
VNSYQWLGIFFFFLFFCFFFRDQLVGGKKTARSRRGMIFNQHLHKRDDDLEKNVTTPRKQVWKMQRSVLQNKNFRILIGVGLLVLFSFFLVTSSSGATVSAVSNSAAKAAKGVDPLSCTKSYDGKRPVTQYVVMIDAGSSGSRVHVYKFNNCKATPHLLNEEFKMMKPGLSSFDTDTEGAAKSLDQLLEVAVKAVPEEDQACTPIAVKATAGLRILGEEKANKILEAVRHRLETEWPFPVVAEDGVAIMDGADEGVYAWITANYLLGNIGSSEKTPTAAVFDLGGGSTQIVFEPTFKVPTERMEEGDHKYDLEFGNRHFSLYQHSHLGYGLNEARKKIHQLVAQNHEKHNKALSSGDTVVNPCLPPGASVKELKVEIPDGIATKDGMNKKEVIVNMSGPKEPSPLQCRQLAEAILNKDEKCTLEPCSFNGVHQPSLVNSFLPESDVYTFSFFYDRTFPIGMPSSFNLNELKDLAFKVCKGKEAYDSFQAIDGAVKELEDEPEWCLDLNYMLAILHTGYDIPINREVKIAKKIKDNELGWCLGASLPLLDVEKGGWTCKIRQQN